MKTSISFLLAAIILIFISSCSKSGGDNPLVYQDDVVKVNFTKVNWFTGLQHYENGLYCGGIGLFIVGSTNADKLFIETFGDGLIGTPEIPLTANKEFADTVGISFLVSQTSPSGKETNAWTEIKAIKGTDTLSFKLESGKLVY